MATNLQTIKAVIEASRAEQNNFTGGLRIEVHAGRIFDEAARLIAMRESLAIAAEALNKIEDLFIMNPNRPPWMTVKEWGEYQTGRESAFNEACAIASPALAEIVARLKDATHEP